MRTAIAMFLTAAVVSGCCCHPSTGKNLAIWHSADATLARRMKAAQTLVPPRTPESTAVQTLGAPAGHWRFNGPIFYAPGCPGYINATNVARADIEQAVYHFSGGDYVTLSFDTGPSPYARRYHPLVGISIGNTNVNNFALYPSGAE